MDTTKKLNGNTLPVAEQVSSTPTLMRDSFVAWLADASNAKKFSPQAAVACLDRISEYVISKKISCSIWEISKPSVYKFVYQKVLEAKLLRIMEKNTHKAFISVGQLYMKFLKEKPWEQAVHNSAYAEEKNPVSKLEQNGEPNEVIIGMKSGNEPKATASLTIKEAVVHVLKDAQQQITAEDIYSRIIQQNLYSFGAQNPINVVRNIIESACDNSNYSEKYRVTIPCFNFEMNSAGKKVYSLLDMNGSVNKMEESHNTNSDVLSKDSMIGSTIWDSRIEHAFQNWLENERYSQKTADNYRRAVAQIFRDYPDLVQRAVENSENELDVVRKYITMLNEDNGFVTANATRHNQFTAALAAFERFYSADIKIVDEGNDTQNDEHMETTSVPSSSLDSIFDLEEGKAGIREILEAHFQTLYGYSNLNILWNATQDNLSLFLNDNAINSPTELWDFLYRAFLGEYVMSYPHIWKTQPNYPQSYVGVVVNLARQFGGTVTREQIDEYFTRIKQASPINTTIIRQGLLMFYAPKHFIISEAVNLTSESCSTITKSLERLFEREKVSYIVLRDITADWFSSLPAIDGSADWTPLLLQEVLRLRPNIGYRVIFSGLDGQALDTLGAAIVPTLSEIHSFADVVHCYCYEQEILGKRMVAEDLRVILRDAGMLEGNELLYNLHKALRDYRFAFTDENRMVKILER